MIRIIVFLLAVGMSTTTLASTMYVFAAASLRNALEDIVDAFQGHTEATDIRLSFAGSSVLARQIMAGAPADVFVSANSTWMDHLQAHGRILSQSRETLVSNRLVLVSHRSGPSIVLDRDTPFEKFVDSGRLAIALVDAVPAGMYAKSALQHLGHWETVAPRMAQADNVRAALQLVALGEAPFGIVYATDAKAETGVHQRGTFPADTHPVIEYPSALIDRPRDSSSDALAQKFHTFLYSETAKTILSEHGFLVDVP